MNGLLDVSFDILVANVTSYCPSVNHLWEFMTTDLIGSEFLFQNFNDCSFWLDIGRIVACWEHESWRSDFFGQGLWTSAKDLFDTEGWMHAANRDNIVEQCRHLEGKPDAPAKTNHKEPLVTLFFKVLADTFESGFHDFKILALDTGDYFPHIHFPVVWFNEQFRQVDVITQRSPCVGKSLVFATGGSEDV